MKLNCTTALSKIFATKYSGLTRVEDSFALMKRFVANQAIAQMT